MNFKRKRVNPRKRRPRSKKRRRNERNDGNDGTRNYSQL